MNEKKVLKVAVIDLFCGIGGLSYGFTKEKVNVLAGIDIDASCKYSFEVNNKSKFIAKSISDVKGNEIKEIFGNTEIKILVGCAPCQPFSSYTFKDKGKKNKNKWGLLYEFSRLIKETTPQIVSMENVAQLRNFKKAPVFKDFIEDLEEMGYKVSYELVHCPDYGIPQNRKRIVLLASKLGEISLIPKTHKKENYVTVRDVLYDLPSIKDGEIYEKDLLHYSRKLSPLNKKRIQQTTYGGSWKDWPEDLRLECHKKKSGKSYPSVYGRMKWDEPSPTMTTHCTGYGNGRFGHPEQDRAISLREASILQTFPAKYKFYDKKKGKYNSVNMAKQIGNAVPVK